MRLFADWCILTTVNIWAIFAYFREWRRFHRHQRRLGVRGVRIAAPRLADEKYLWRKVFDHDPRFTTVSDKIACKDWVAEQGFDVQTPQTLWAGTDANDIPDGLWDTPIFIKAAHGSLMNIPVLSPPIDRAPIIAGANGFLAQDHGKIFREWAYDDVPRRILVEEALFVGQQMMDIKYYTFGGIVEQFVISRFGSPVTSARWQRQPDGQFARDAKPTTVSPILDTLPLPPAADKGLGIASDIGARFDHMRVDIMTDGDAIYLGELTVYNQTGRANLQGHYADAPLNRSWDLRQSWFLTNAQDGWRGWYAGALRRTIARREKNGHGLA